MHSSPLFQWWLSTAFKHSAVEYHGPSSSVRLRVSALQLLADLLVNHLPHLDDDTAQQILSTLKKAIRDKNALVLTKGASSLFGLLRFLAELQHPLAGLAYKMLVFALIENY